MFGWFGGRPVTLIVIMFNLLRLVMLSLTLPVLIPGAGRRRWRGPGRVFGRDDVLALSEVSLVVALLISVYCLWGPGPV